MNIRSVTSFANIGDSQSIRDAVQSGGQVAAQVQQALECAGFGVQTKRLATQPLSDLPVEPLALVDDLWSASAAAGFDFLAMGPCVADSPGADLSCLDQIPELISSTDSVFASICVARHGAGINLAAIQRAATAIRQIAHRTALGFGNLRLTVLANVGPHSPFFPSAYHDGGPPALGLATESANLAVEAFSEATSLEDARQRLVEAVNATARRIVGAVQPVTDRHGVRFTGIDFSLAPFPEEACSIGAAVERLGVDRFGAPGTLFVASLLTGCLRQAEYPRCGFNGLMLPVLEDATLAQRSCENLFTVNDLLLYSAVCGTGLDTVPLPGDISEDELAGILLDMTALALRWDKPLTARLMPVPGAAAGDMTEFDFPYFANGRVLDIKGVGSRKLFKGESWLPF